MIRRAGVCCALLTLVVAFAVGGCSRAVVPSEYTTFTAEDQSFKFDAPVGWQSTYGGKNGNYLATFTSGGAEISVSVDVVGSILGDIANTANQMGGTEEVPELSPLVQAHTRNGEAYAEDLKYFKDLNTVDLQMPIGAGKKSEYTGKGGLGKPQHGYRVTALLTNQQLRICCQCPENEWKALQPTFDRVLTTIAYGK